MALDHERVTGHRIHPARQPRWRRYLPSIVALVPAAAAFAAAGRIVDLGARATLGPHASLTLAAALLAGLVTLAAALANRPPARWYIASVAAVSLGSNLAPDRWLLAPLLALGLVGLTVREVERRFDGVTIGTTGVTLHRPLKDALTVDYDDVNAVHTTPAAGDAGTLILETVHGTVTARDLPGVENLQARLEARMSDVTVDDPEDAARRARETIQELVRGGNPS